MKFIEYKEKISESLIQECRHKIRERGGSPGQVVIHDLVDGTVITVRGTIEESISLPVRLGGPVTTLDELDIKTGRKK